MSHILRAVEYDSQRTSHKGLVAYVIVGQCVYFSGVRICNEASSTNNAAENVIKAITEHSRMTLDKMTFFDIITHRTVRKSCNLGSYAIDRLEVSYTTGEPLVLNWIREQEMPAEIIKVFSALIYE